MPIVNSEGSTQLEFGYGDINVSPGLLKTEETIGAVCFNRGNAGEVGVLINHLPAGKEVELGDTPVRMTFTKVESIDVVVRALLETKELMLRENFIEEFKKLSEGEE